ncbi:YciK family oxidoreductase [Salinivibrio sp. MA427]|uniref:YciK family oxidoreductase n=1 Tax=Salinivibrio costicola subsp. alcaliphilus TaxID=272773 RepID=A0ABX3KS09_SALCS|nr:MULTISPECIES: YciK family oxidoreductase [Salinivibrio]NUY56530.1 YciK family oxidoreductase [Salinivibrio sp. EAGSL]OOE88776.1 YciK family oxidoreductase [Salinivibrio sp. AR640]OOE91961.1 YciK family oxidoreductase [Salinivibrio sp. AR647]OOF03767.1 YciK family oxidoreductase [Salinivibrio sp. MA440]OOF13392.1 YciK family oxidoreductase [Salinivibrio sp. MA427]
MDYQVTSDALQGRVILVTGAGAGIGRQAALSYAEKGATVILLGRTVKKLEAVYDEITATGAPQPAIIPLDMLGATRQHYLDMADTIDQQFGRLDGVLHNAGLLGVLSPFDQIDEKSHDDVMQVNVKATMLMTQALLPLLKKSDDARVVFTTSTVGHQGRAYWGSYAISKFATEGMMQVLADEMSDTKVRVNAINPGGTRTSMRASAFPGEDPDTLKTPLDIIPLYVYLMAPEGVEVHGQCIDAQPKR